MWCCLMQFAYVMGWLICLGVCFLTALAEKFCLQKGKCAYSINYDIAPYFRCILMNDVKDSEFYVILFDESLNTIIQMVQVDLVINFWDNIVNKV